MKFKAISFLGLLTLSLFIYSFTNNTLDRNDITANSFTIVELYTSQGCSSCPRADKVLNEITEAYKGKNVFPLSFHVDYWDRLGWKDTFSKKVFSQRQYKYSEYFKRRQVYTPQMIVNGKYQFNGGDKGTAFKLINNSLKKKAVVKITGSVKELKSKLLVNYTIPDAVYNQYTINAVLVKNKEKVAIKRGENSNKQITYSNIVIDLKTKDLNERGSIVLETPIDYKKENYRVVLFLQEKKSGRITGGIL